MGPAVYGSTAPEDVEDGKASATPVSRLAPTALFVAALLVVAATAGFARPMATADASMRGTVSVKFKCSSIRLATQTDAEDWAFACGCDAYGMATSDGSGWMTLPQCPYNWQIATSVEEGAAASPGVQSMAKAFSATKLAAPRPMSAFEPPSNGIKANCSSGRTETLEEAQQLSVFCGCDPDMAMDTSDGSGFMTAPTCSTQLTYNPNFAVAALGDDPLSLPGAKIKCTDWRFNSLKEAAEFATACGCDPSAAMDTSDGTGYMTGPNCPNTMIYDNVIQKPSGADAKSMAVAKAAAAQMPQNESVATTPTPLATFAMSMQAPCSAFRWSTLDQAQNSPLAQLCGCNADLAMNTMDGSGFMTDPKCTAIFKLSQSYFSEPNIDRDLAGSNFPH